MAAPTRLVPSALQPLFPTLPVPRHSPLRWYDFGCRAADGRRHLSGASFVEWFCGPPGCRVATSAYFFRPFHPRFHPSTERHAARRSARLRCTIAMEGSHSSLKKPSHTSPTRSVTSSSTLPARRRLNGLRHFHPSLRESPRLRRPLPRRPRHPEIRYRGRLRLPIPAFKLGRRGQTGLVTSAAPWSTRRGRLMAPRHGLSPRPSCNGA